MFIFLSKFLPLLVYPLGLACLLLFLSLLVSYKRKTSNILIAIALIVLWLSSTTGFSDLLARSLELKYLPPAEIPTGEVLVVLGGGTEPASPPRTTVEINGAGDRVLYAAELYKEGKAPFILLSGGDIEWLSSGSTTPAEDMATLLMQMGVPESALWLETESKNTYENALYAKEFLEEQDINQILLITSAMPLPVDFSVTDSISASSGEGNFISKLIDIMPSASNLALTTNAMKEYLGYFMYKLQGWL